MFLRFIDKKKPLQEGLIQVHNVYSFFSSAVILSWASFLPNDNAFL
jgi:hypothetical protein